MDARLLLGQDDLPGDGVVVQHAKHVLQLLIDLLPESSRDGDMSSGQFETHGRSIGIKHKAAARRAARQR
jgi:hypothetical protein